MDTSNRTFAIECLSLGDLDVDLDRLKVDIDHYHHVIHRLDNRGLLQSAKTTA